eukprot:1582493-Prymnesium_polylepis.1
MLRGAGYVLRVGGHVLLEWVGVMCVLRGWSRAPRARGGSGPRAVRGAGRAWRRGRRRGWRRSRRRSSPAGCAGR